MPIYNETGSGGAVVNGSSTNRYIEVGSGGIGASGNPLIKFTYNPRASGGAENAGAAVELVTKLVSGGATAAGLATISVVYDPFFPDFRVNLLGSKVVPPTESTEIATAEFSYDAFTNIATWHIRHDLSDITAVRFRGPAVPGEIGPIVHTVEDNLESPIIGSLELTESQRDGLLDGFGYIQITTETYPAGELRGQIWFNAVNTAGRAFFTYDIEVEGDIRGVAGGGDAIVDVSYQPAAGGPLGGGAAEFGKLYDLYGPAQGGVVTAGEARTVPFAETGDGGVIINGSGNASVPYTHEPLGGVECSSRALITHFFTASGGAEAGGEFESYKSFDHTATGGLVCSAEAETHPIAPGISGGAELGGDSLIVPYIEIITGGTEVGGSAIVQAVYTGTIGSTIYSFNILPDHAVPPNTLPVPWKGYAKVRLNPATDTIRLQFNHTAGPVKNMTFRGPAVRGQIGPVQIPINDTESPDVEFFGLSQTQQNQIIAGLWYLHMDLDFDRLMRGQVANLGPFLNGHAAINETINLESAGVGCAGLATVTGVKDTPIVSGGVFVGGASIEHRILIDNGIGGAEGGGSNDAQCEYNTFGIDGSVVAGDSIALLDLYVIGDSGAVCAGVSIIGIDQGVFGGAVSGGEVTIEYLLIPPISGGAVVHGIPRVTQFWANYLPIGGVFASGQARKERIRILVSSLHRGVALALVSDNKLKQPPAPLLIRPTEDETPKLEDGFRYEQSAAWCDVEERCEEGVLPRIVQRRQGEHIPPKKRPDFIRDRTIARIS